MTDFDRVHVSNGTQPLQERDFVIYWMQASQRIGDNPALDYAISQADSLHKPLIVYFGITPRFPQASKRQYAFMLEGLRSIREGLKGRKIRFLLSLDGPVEGLRPLVGQTALLVTDVAYGKVERAWRKEVLQLFPCPVVQVEGNVIIPIHVASGKEEYSAATLRRKIEPMISHFATLSPEVEYRGDSRGAGPEGAETQLDDIESLMEALGIEDSACRISWIKGGEQEALSRLEDFVENRLEGYGARHSDPADPYVSYLSPYLHFGQISPSRIYHAVSQRRLPDVPVFLEELVVRRELAMNFVSFNPLFDCYEGLPAWAIKSLELHETDVRPHRYDFETLKHARTHDPYWNAAQRELLHLGTMHGYMRMYWGKKILEWSSSPRKAFEIALHLNNTYQLDGRDPNGYAGVAWCFGKHDRPWVERPIFGNIRYMNDNGLKRKFDIDRYVRRIETQVLALGQA